MPELNLKPTHKTVQDYYRVLSQMDQLNIDHEMAVRSAFQSVLIKCGQQFDWTLVPEYSVRRPKQMPLKVDGALIDTMRLTQGFWEAKDERDELEREVDHKLSLGYPDKNIIFQSPKKAILIQNGRLAWKNSIEEPDALVDVLHQFFGWTSPNVALWRDAAERFKTEVPEQSRALKEIIDEQHKKNRAFVEAFTAFVETCRQALNPNLSEDAVERMLIQHILTERIFSKVFDNEDFRTRNVVAVEIEKVIATLIKGSFNRGDFLRRLDPFYKAIEQSAANTTGYTEKQDFLNTVYERFFQGFSPKEADTHGIVYTPQPIVDFMVRSVEDILEKEFGKSLADKGVHILDPFVGTGNFITRVMKEIAAKKKSALPYKYANELHCNEIMLLPYYIASMNIEHEYLDAMDEYEPFPGMCLVDTFDMRPQASMFAEENVARIERQRMQPIFVLIGNPPYNVGQENENDNNKNRKYLKDGGVDTRIAETYAKSSRATNKNALSDPYVRAFRWASDRVKEEGIVAFVTNSGFVDSIAADGMRKHLLGDFDEIYVLDLGGNVRRNPKLSGTTHNIFGIQVGVAVNLLLRKKGKRERRACKIHYAKTDDFWRKEQKYRYLDEVGDRSGVAWTILQPDTKSNWLTTGLESEFDSFTVIAGEERSLFQRNSRGVATCRDAWAYNFAPDQLAENIKRTAEFFDCEILRWRHAGKPKNVDDFVHYEDTKISWSRDLKADLKRERFAEFDDSKIRAALYRPFTKTNIYFDRILNEEVYVIPAMLPTAVERGENRLMWLKVGSDWPMFAVATDVIPDLLPQGGSQCFPFYIYDEDGTNRRENITEWALEQFRTHYADPSITKWDIFYYVYAVLHHPEYRERYAANLKRELPRVPFVGAVERVGVPRSARDDNRVFHEFAKAGERLAELHVKYEEQPDVTEAKRGPATGGGGATKPGPAGLELGATKAGQIDEMAKARQIDVMPKARQIDEMAKARPVDVAPDSSPAGPACIPTWLENPQGKVDYRVGK